MDDSADCKEDAKAGGAAAFMSKEDADYMPDEKLLKQANIREVVDLTASQSQPESVSDVVDLTKEEPKAEDPKVVPQDEPKVEKKVQKKVEPKDEPEPSRSGRPRR